MFDLQLLSSVGEMASLSCHILSQCGSMYKVGEGGGVV